MEKIDRERILLDSANLFITTSDALMEILNKLDEIVDWINEQEENPKPDNVIRFGDPDSQAMNFC